MGHLVQYVFYFVISFLPGWVIWKAMERFSPSDAERERREREREREERRQQAWESLP